MRLLLILALLVASVGFGPTVAAQAHHEATQHHSHAADGDHRHGEHDGDRQDEAFGAAHVCLGCALVGQPADAVGSMLPTPLPRLPGNPPSLRSFDSNPIPPPPRLS